MSNALNDERSTIMVTDTKTKKKMKLTHREHMLIRIGLYLLECDCQSRKLDPDLADELHGAPDADEVRRLMIRMEEFLTLKVTTLCEQDE